MTSGNAMRVIAFRLLPGADLKQSLNNYCKEHKIDAACIVSCVGSLRRAGIRYADADESVLLEGKFEIVSLVGTLSQHGCHLHIAVSDRQGRVSGGHLMDGSYIYTTGEVLLGIIPDMIFKRVHDVSTGYRELEADQLE